MDHKTAPWPWKSVHENIKEVIFDAAMREQIKHLAAGWSITESGAACLFDDELEELDDSEQDNLTNGIELFLRNAKVETWKGVIKNPYAGRDLPRYFAPEYLDSIPDKDIAAKLKSGEDIEFEATKDDIALWNAANLNGAGVDPKRPFGTGLVSRDIRALVDPDKQVSNAKFSKWRKTLEARMVFMLLFFAQNAELPSGTYVNDQHFNWVPASSISDETDRIDFCEWYDRCTRSFYYTNRDYHRVLKSIAVLVEDDRLRGSYEAFVQQFKLDNFFAERSTRHREYKVNTDRIVEQGYRFFPGVTGDPEQSTFALMLVRILNSQAQFAEACELLKETGHLEKYNRSLERLTYSTDTLFLLESLIARFGNGDIDESVFSTMTDGRWDADYNPRRLRIYRWAREVMFASKYPDGVDYGVAAHAQAVAAQLFIMDRCLDKWHRGS